MKPRKKGNKWEINYYCPGYTKTISERFSTYEEAKKRAAEVEYEKSIGELRPPVKIPGCTDRKIPKYITVSELLDEYVELYGLNHWGDSYLSCVRHRIDDYIKPYIGNVPISSLTTHNLDRFFSALQDKPAVILKGHTDKTKKVSPSVIKKSYDVLRSALNQAVAWGYIPSNPAQYVSLPKLKKNVRDVWSREEAQYAIQICTDEDLKLCMLLAIGCSLRIGEILGLTWDCIDISEKSVNEDNAFLFVNKEIKRCDKKSLEDLKRRGHDGVVFTFPEVKKNASTTSLVLKSPKTDSSIRKVYLPKTVATALAEAKTRQEKLKELLGNGYSDFNLVIAHSDGRPFEERQIARRFKLFNAENNLPPVVFHSLRHCSTSIKLEISGGNIKAVQGDTGHSVSRMVTDVYAHTHDRDRKNLARKMEQEFFQTSRANSSEDNSADMAYKLLKENPQVAQLIISLLNAKDGI